MDQPRKLRVHKATSLNYETTPRPQIFSMKVLLSTGRRESKTTTSSTGGITAPGPRPSGLGWRWPAAPMQPPSQLAPLPPLIPRGSTLQKPKFPASDRRPENGAAREDREGKCLRTQVFLHRAAGDGKAVGCHGAGGPPHGARSACGVCVCVCVVCCVLEKERDGQQSGKGR